MQSFLISVVVLVAFLNLFTINISDSNEATIWSARAAIAQAIFAALMCIFAFYTSKMQRDLTERQNKLSERQTEIAEEQKEMTHRQINLELYKRRFEIYDALIKLMKETIEIYMELPKTLQENNEFHKNKVIKSVNIFDDKVKEREFLFDKKMNDFINEVKDHVLSFTHATEITTDGNIDWEKFNEKILKLKNNYPVEIYNKFKLVLDFTKI